MEEVTGREIIQTLLLRYYGTSSILLPLYEMVINHIHNNTYISSYSVIPFSEGGIGIKDFFGETLYSLFVLVCGGYGLLLKNGWIDDLEGFRNILRTVIRRYLSQ